MPELTAEDYYRAARQLLPELDDVRKAKIEELLAQAETGMSTDNQIVEIICETKILREYFRKLLHIPPSIGMMYQPFGGDRSSPDAIKYMCPEPGHNFIRRIQRAGEDPGNCPIHHVPLIPINEKRNP